MSSPHPPLSTCDGVDLAQRAALLGERRSYLAALRSSLLAARRSIYILGWDVDDRLELPSTDAREAEPRTLLALLLHVLEARPELRVFVSAWDPSPVHALDDQQRPGHGFAAAHPRLQYRMDAQHVASAAHHEQLIVIDDWLAYVGSVDLTSRRWGEAGSAAQAGEAPIAQLCVQGASVRELARFARERTLSSEPLASPPADAPQLWPRDLPSDLTDVEMGVARTRPALPGEQSDVHTALASNLAAIAAARRHIYIETQYLSSAAIVEALCGALSTPSGPELVLVLPRDRHGWLEQQVMLDLRNDALQRLAAHDSEQRLRVYQPSAAAHAEPLQSRLMIVDDQLLKVGSSNLSNRSMTLDTECDVWLRADNHEQRAAFEQLLMRLVARHICARTPDGAAVRGHDLAALCATFKKSGSLTDTIEAHDPARQLEPIDVPDGAQRPSLGARLLDLEQPSPAEVFRRYFASGRQKPSRARVALLATLALLAAALFALLLISGSNPQSTIRTTLSALLERVRDPRVGLLYVLLAYGLGTLVCAPITVLFAATTLLLSPLRGFCYALLGGHFGATLAYLIGRALGSRHLQRVSGRRLGRLRHEVRTHSVRAVVIARFLPIGNFTLINVFLGGLKVPYWAFVVGNTVGMVPGLLGLTLLSDQLQEAIHAPSIVSIGRLVLIGAVVLIAAFGASRVFSRLRAQRERVEASKAGAASPEESLSP